MSSWRPQNLNEAAEIRFYAPGESCVQGARDIFPRVSVELDGYYSLVHPTTLPYPNRSTVKNLPASSAAIRPGAAPYPSMRVFSGRTDILGR